MRCLVCKADSMEESQSSYFVQLENCYVIIENVSCRRCSQCGEVVYSAAVMERIEGIQPSAISLDYDVAIRPEKTPTFKVNRTSI